MRNSLSLCAAVVLGSMMVGCAHEAEKATTASQMATQASPAKVAATKMALRDLWLGHIQSIRNVAVATVDNNTAAREAAEGAVVANAKQIAGSIEPFYGKPASEKLFTLLAGHYAGVREHLDATVAGNASGQEAAVKHITENAGEISSFLSGANPKNWPKDAVMGLLGAHAAHHIQQFQQLKAGDYVHEGDTWAGMKSHIYVVADTLTTGLAVQFPDKF
ncbi:MAG: hypothetical protein U0172_04980 [Nitrospiraceae bacterium]